MRISDWSSDVCSSDLELPHLLRQVVLMAAHHRAVHGLAAAELRRPHRALTGAAGTLLPVRLLGGAADLRDALGLVRAGTPLGELPVHDPGEDVAARIQAEDRLVAIHPAGLPRLAVGALTQTGRATWRARVW